MKHEWLLMTENSNLNFNFIIFVFKMNQIKNLLVFLILVKGYNLFAQNQQVNMAIGDTLHIGKCKMGETFEYIDIYTKTRIVDTAKYNEETGEGFVDYYFGRGDFDGGRMPCKYTHTPIIIAAYKKVRNKQTKSEQTIILAWVDKAKLQLAMIEIEKAWESGEVIQ
jgi:hypothetical protein